jgi:hypothetical protein
MRRVRTVIVRPAGREKKEAKPKRDWVPISISSLSLLISLLGMYFTALLQTDDVRLVFDELPILAADQDRNLIINNRLALTWINSGNRAAAISSVRGFVKKLEKEEQIGRDCAVKTFPFSLNLGIEPFILKAGDISRVTPNKLEGFGIVTDPEGRKNFYMIPNNIYRPAAGDTLLVCIVTRFVTPDDFVRDSTTAVLKFKFWEQTFDSTDTEGQEKKRTIMGAEVEQLYDKARPLQLVSRNRWFDKLRSAFGLS